MGKSGGGKVVEELHDGGKPMVGTKKVSRGG